MPERYRVRYYEPTLSDRVADARLNVEMARRRHRRAEEQLERAAGELDEAVAKLAALEAEYRAALARL